MAAAQDRIGMAVTHVPPEVVPFGGKEPYLGTGPLAASVPTPSAGPITMDVATSLVAMGKFNHVAAENGEEIPPDWAVDQRGEPTTDPETVHALRPIGGAEGYCLAVMNVFEK